MFRLDMVDYADDATHSVSSRYYDDMYIRVEYHPIAEVLTFAKEQGFDFDEQIIEKARRKVNEEFLEDMIEPNEAEASESELQNNPVVSDFAMLLQNALSSCVKAS